MQYNISADTYEQRGSCEFLQGKSRMHSALERQFVCFRAQMLVENAHLIRIKDEKEMKGLSCALYRQPIFTSQNEAIG